MIALNILMILILLILIALETEIVIRLKNRSLKPSGIMVYNAIKFIKIIDVICIILFNI